MWKETISSICQRCVFDSPATTAQVEEIEKFFGVSLPKDLKALLLESNGILGPIGLPVVWDTSVIKAHNSLMRNDAGMRRSFMPFDHLLFFGEDGGGDLFGYGISPTNEITSNRIYRWAHEGDDRETAAYSLEAYLKYALRHCTEKT